MDALDFPVVPSHETTGNSSPRNSQAMAVARMHEDERVLFGVTTPFSNMVVARCLPASMSIGEAIEALKRTEPKEPWEACALHYVAAEQACEPCGYYALDATGGLRRVEIESSIGSISVRVETRMPRGPETVKAARAIVQGFDCVGGHRG